MGLPRRTVNEDRENGHSSLAPNCFYQLEFLLRPHPRLPLEHVESQLPLGFEFMIDIELSLGIFE